MMTTTEILKEIKSLPISERQKIKENLLEDEELNGVTQEVLWEMLADGLISKIPQRMTDEDDDFEPIEIEGKPMSETILEDRN